MMKIDNQNDEMQWPFYLGIREFTTNTLNPDQKGRLLADNIF